MARCLQSAQEFIHASFPAMVAALTSEDAELLCQKNGLSFVELVRPFSQLSTEAHIRDPSNPNIVVSVKNWKLRILDMQATPPPQVLVKRVLTEVVNKSLPVVDLKSKGSVEKQINGTTPWFDAFRDCFFQLLEPMDHEFIRQFLACILVVSSKHPDPMNAFAALSSRQNSVQQARMQGTSHSNTKPHYKWFSSNTFKYYLLLHDVSDGEDAKAEAVYQSMKSVYGSHTCFMLQINSRPKMFPQANENSTGFSDPWTQHIYPYTDETFDIDESEIEKPSLNLSPGEVNPLELDKTEEAIVNELESIDKKIEETHSSPKCKSFNDPLTSMEYKESLNDDAATEDSIGILIDEASHDKTVPRTRKISERSMKVNEYKRSLSQFSYSMVAGGKRTVRKERGQCLTLVDQDKIAAFVYEFAVRGLLPHIEKLMRTISEQILARRGIHKSIFNATKKWFGSNKTVGGNIGTGFSSGNIYPNDAPELQHRKLADLAFLVQHFDLAYNSYHSAKREFNNDHAWVYFAGALEMAAISAFMHGSQRVYPVHYFEACISTYLNTCRMPEYALRACLMSTEALKARDMYPEAASEFIKLTNEDADLRSALLLEQAAHCFLHNKPPMYRKYAFHMILAGHRFSKAMQRKHTLRCYIHALQIYQHKGWNLAEDHVNFTIGRQSFNLGNLHDAQASMQELLLYESEQPASQQAAHLREFLAVFKQYLESRKDNVPSDYLPKLSLPKIVSGGTKVLLSVKPNTNTKMEIASTGPSQASRRTRTLEAGSYSFQKSYSKSYVAKWEALEKQIVQFVTGELPYPFKPFVPCLSSTTDNKNNPLISVDESFAVELEFSNPLKMPLNLLNLTILWEFSTIASDGSLNAVISNKEVEQNDIITADTIDNLLINAAENKKASFVLTVHQAGHLKIVGVKYMLSSIGVTSAGVGVTAAETSVNQDGLLKAAGVLGMQELKVKGPRLNSSKQERSTVAYGDDKRLEPHVIPALPELQVTMNDLPVTLLCGEVQKCSFTFKNIGKIGLKNLYVTCNIPECFAFGKRDSQLSTLDENILKNSNCISEKNVCIDLDDGILQPKSEITLPVWIYGLEKCGIHEIYFLFYYEPVEQIKKAPYRLLQQMVRLQTLSTLSLKLEERSNLPNVEDLGCKNEEATHSSSMKDAVLSLHVENKSKGSTSLRCVEFKLKQLTCLSPHWKLHTITEFSQDPYQLRPDETLTLHLKATEVQSTIEEQGILSQVPLGESCTLEAQFPSLELFMKSRNAVGLSKDSIGIILFWETFFIDESFTRVVINGQSHVSLHKNVLQTTEQTSYHSPSNVDIPTEIDSTTNNQIIVAYEYLAKVNHDFKLSRYCSIDVSILCYNSSNEPAEIQLEARDVAENSNNEEPSSSVGEAMNLIQWVGNRYSSEVIPANSYHSFSLTALISAIGLYEIQNIAMYKSPKLTESEATRTAIELPKSQFVCVEQDVPTFVESPA